MSDASEIREAVSRTDHCAITDAALAYADSLEDPIWWCFEHGRPVPTLPDGGPYFKTCVAEESRRIHNLPPTQCDIAKATRPRRIR